VIEIASFNQITSVNQFAFNVARDTLVAKMESSDAYANRMSGKDASAFFKEIYRSVTDIIEGAE